MLWSHFLIDLCDALFLMIYLKFGLLFCFLPTDLIIVIAINLMMMMIMMIMMMSDSTFMIPGDDSLALWLFSIWWFLQNGTGFFDDDLMRADAFPAAISRESLRPHAFRCSHPFVNLVLLFRGQRLMLDLAELHQRFLQELGQKGRESFPSGLDGWQARQRTGWTRPKSPGCTAYAGETGGGASSAGRCSRPSSCQMTLNVCKLTGHQKSMSCLGRSLPPTRRSLGTPMMRHEKDPHRWMSAGGREVSLSNSVAPQSSPFTTCLKEDHGDWIHGIPPQIRKSLLKP